MRLPLAGFSGRLAQGMFTAPARLLSPQKKVKAVVGFQAGWVQSELMKKFEWRCSKPVVLKLCVILNRVLVIPNEAGSRLVSVALYSKQQRLLMVSLVRFPKLQLFEMVYLAEFPKLQLFVVVSVARFPKLQLTSLYTFYTYQPQHLLYSKA